jgi:hypothetical protein
LNIVKVVTSTIERRLHISLRGGESDRCSASNLLGKHSVSFLLTAAFTISFSSVAIVFPQPIIVLPAIALSAPGVR